MRTHLTSLTFVREKIRNIGSALFYSDQDSVLKFPTSIITALKVDEVGQVWFYLNRPSQFIHQFDTQFPARLDFFRKGKNYFLSILGKAFIVTDPEEISLLLSLDTEMDKMAMEKMILLKLKIQRIGYFERWKEANSAPHWWNGIVNAIYHFLFPHGTRQQQRYFQLQ
jgi:hypothetical protein